MINLEWPWTLYGNEKNGEDFNCVPTMAFFYSRSLDGAMFSVISLVFLFSFWFLAAFPVTGSNVSYRVNNVFECFLTTGAAL